MQRLQSPAGASSSNSHSGHGFSKASVHPHAAMRTMPMRQLGSSHVMHRALQPSQLRAQRGYTVASEAPVTASTSRHDVRPLTSEQIKQQQTELIKGECLQMHRSVRDLVDKNEGDLAPKRVMPTPQSHTVGWGEIQQLYTSLAQSSTAGAAIAATNAGSLAEASQLWGGMAEQEGPLGVAARFGSSLVSLHQGSPDAWKGLLKVLQELDGQLAIANQLLAAATAKDHMLEAARSKSVVRIVQARQAAAMQALAVALCMAGRYAPDSNAGAAAVAGGPTDAHTAAIQAWQLNADAYGHHAIPTIEAKFTLAAAMAGGGNFTPDAYDLAQEAMYTYCQVATTDSPASLYAVVLMADVFNNSKRLADDPMSVLAYNNLLYRMDTAAGKLQSIGIAAPKEWKVPEKERKFLGGYMYFPTAEQLEVLRTEGRQVHWDAGSQRSFVIEWPFRQGSGALNSTSNLTHPGAVGALSTDVASGAHSSVAPIPAASNEHTEGFLSQDYERLSTMAHTVATTAATVSRQLQLLEWAVRARIKACELEQAIQKGAAKPSDRSNMDSEVEFMVQAGYWAPRAARHPAAAAGSSSAAVPGAGAGAGASSKGGEPGACRWPPIPLTPPTPLMDPNTWLTFDYPRELCAPGVIV